jgi:hypothetical protein
MKKIVVISAGLLSISATSAFAHPGPHDFSQEACFISSPNQITLP